MATTGAKAPTAVVTAAESPWLDNDWVNPVNIYGAGYAEVSAATYDAGDQTYVLKAYGFDMSAIPAGSSIEGVTVVIVAKYATAAVSIDLCQLLDVSRAKVGTNLAATPQALTTSDASYTFGSTSNKWGNSLDAAWIKDPDFGVAIGCLVGASNNADVYIDSVTLNVSYTPPIDLVINDNVHNHISDSPAITQVHVLTVDANVHSHLSDNLTATQVHILIAAENLHSHVSDSPDITQVHILTVDPNIHAHLSDGYIVIEQSESPVDLIPAENIHEHVSDNVAITQVHSILINDNVHGHVSDNVDVTQIHVLSANENLHGHLSDNVSATQIHSIAVQENLHSHVSDSFAITQIHILSVNENLHSHLSDNIAVTQGGAEVDLIANDNVHTHISDTFDITQDHSLLINDNLHFESFAILSINDNVHGHISDHVTDIYVCTDLNHEIIYGVTSFMILFSAISYFNTTISGDYLYFANIDGTYDPTLDIFGQSDITDEILMQLIFR